ncbi:undecaprenyl diphosphate synthase family protein [Desulfotomaculum nigrificans]|uniref:undecaprenyl diphosphate synthase family protein n=1 Tax=Desulfotomaculum nigrificans TaxID=1565 RepID=UPI0001FADF2B|nr:undecaprenyl diphosphate synthase family protein [Desulfotomaculum nigrificans]
MISKFKRLPKHIGIIPDGNRRWAQLHNLPKHAGYDYGIKPGFTLYETCLELGIPEVTFYGFTQDNTKRPAVQKQAFQKACVDAVNILANRDASLLVIGNSASPQFPKELLPFTSRQTFGRDLIKINFLVNYSWKWDLSYGLNNGPTQDLHESIASKDISRIDLIIRWGGRRRLSGFLPVQSIYADFYIVDELWPDFQLDQFYEALRWYETQDITLGG